MKLERTELEAQVIQSLREGPKTIKQLASARRARSYVRRRRI